MKPLSLSFKLSLFIITGVTFAVGVLGLYFDDFLKKDYFQSAEKRIQHGFFQLNSDLTQTESELKKGITFVQSDDAFLASVDLVNNYQDKNDYNAILLDEEKKRIAKVLLDKVKYSLNYDIALYDCDSELIAYVYKQNGAYRLNFVSYAHGDRTLFSRSEHDARYTEHPFEEHPLIPFKHLAYYKAGDVNNKSVITYRLLDDNAINIRSHRDIVNPASDRVDAHIEMSQELGDAYFKSLSDTLGISVAASRDDTYAQSASKLCDSARGGAEHIFQTATAYFSVAMHPTSEANVYFILSIDKAPLTAALDNNRRQLLVIMAFVLVIALAGMRFLVRKSLVKPLNALMEQIRNIEKQDYSVSEPVHTGDELEHISQNINRLARTVQERESALKLSQKRFEHLSFHDALTGLPNRRMFITRLEHALEQAKRSGEKLAVLFLDLDDFKQINDTLSHHTGDILLQEVAKRLGKTIRTADTFARIGGDEFNLLVENVKSVGDLETLIAKLLAAFDTPFSCNGNDIYTGTSIGVALYPDDGADAYTLIKHADLAMYRAKEEGHSRACFFSKELSDFITMRAECINAMKKALQSGTEFHLRYQPKISLQTGTVVGVEALVRWESETIGAIVPDRFIPVAEETNLIIPLGERIMEQAFSDFVALQRDGVDVGTISVNVSPVQLLGSDLIRTLHHMIRKTGIRPEQIELEITENTIAKDEKKTLKTLREIRRMGIALSIDDFGTGYSSMSYLHRLPVNRLKIDKSFVEHLPESTESIAVVKAIIAMAKTFNLSITAEGVETDAQLAFLKTEQCDDIQGFYYSKPLTPEALKAFIHSRKASL